MEGGWEVEVGEGGKWKWTRGGKWTGNDGMRSVGCGSGVDSKIGSCIPVM